MTPHTTHTVGPRSACAHRRSVLAATLVLLALASSSAAHAELRVAALLPSVDAAIADLPGAVQVAGVRASMHAPERSDVIDLGSPHSPNFERLAEARADVIVGDRALHAAQASRLGAFAEVMLIDSASVDGMLEGFEALGARAGDGARAAMAERVARVRADLEGLRIARSVPVLVLFGTPGSFLVMTDRTWLGGLLEAQGFENVAGRAGGQERVPGFAAISHERMVVMRPELVLLVAHGDPRAIQAALDERLDDGGTWQAIGKSATRGVHVLDPRLFSANPGLDLPRAARVLRELATGPVATAR